MNILNPKKAAMDFAAAQLKKGFKFEALHEYTNEQGDLIYWRIRLKHPATGEKWIRPFFYNGQKYQIGEPKSKKLKPLYNLQQLAANKQDIVYVVEGEQCVDALTKLDILSCTSGSADSVNKAEWSILENRKVFIWPDNDDAGNSFAENLLEILTLLHCEIYIVDIEKLDLSIKADVIDWLKKNPTAKKEDIFNLPCLTAEMTKQHKTELEQDEKQSQSSMLVAFVEANTMLFHDKNKEAYAQDKQTKETRKLNSRDFRDWLSSEFYDKTKKSPRDQSVREALATLSGICRYRGECDDVFIRVAEKNDTHYLDLGQRGNNKAIKITKDGWSIIDNPPVRFIRPENLLPLPEPSSSGNIDYLWDLVNIPENSKLLVITWLCDCLRLSTPFPVLELIGEQGSAKSTTQNILRRLIDPNVCNLRAAPKKVEDIFVSAGVNWLASYENISYLSPDMQDALCILATGGGFSKRKLYSDADETIIDVKRATIINGISASITAQDLIDRTISIELPIIQYRRQSNSIENIFELLHGSIIGAILDIFVKALGYLPDIDLPIGKRPRLVEFACLGMAIAKVLNHEPEVFLEQFNASRQESISRTIDASPVATALIDWCEIQNDRHIELPAKQLFEKISFHKPLGTDAWPKTPKGFADALRRLAPALRQIGIDCTCQGKRGSHVHWLIQKK